MARSSKNAIKPALLPTEFSHLEQFAAKWGLATDRARNAMRLSSDMSEITQFYDAMLGSLEGILGYLSRCDASSLTQEARVLFRMALSFAESAAAVELYRQPSVVDGFDPSRFPRYDVPNMTPTDI